MLVQDRSLAMSASSICFASSCTPFAGASFSFGLEASLDDAEGPPGALAFLAAALFFFESLTCRQHHQTSVPPSNHRLKRTALQCKRFLLILQVVLFMSETFVSRQEQMKQSCIQGHDGTLGSALS